MGMDVQPPERSWAGGHSRARGRCALSAELGRGFRKWSVTFSDSTTGQVLLPSFHQPLFPNSVTLAICTAQTASYAAISAAKSLTPSFIPDRNATSTQHRLTCEHTGASTPHGGRRQLSHQGCKRIPRLLRAPTSAWQQQAALFALLAGVSWIVQEHFWTAQHPLSYPQPNHPSRLLTVNSQEEEPAVSGAHHVLAKD